MEMGHIALGGRNALNNRAIMWYPLIIYKDYIGKLCLRNRSSEVLQASAWHLSSRFFPTKRIPSACLPRLVSTCCCGFNSKARCAQESLAMLGVSFSRRRVRGKTLPVNLHLQQPLRSCPLEAGWVHCRASMCLMVCPSFPSCNIYTFWW